MLQRHDCLGWGERLVAAVPSLMEAQRGAIIRRIHSLVLGR
jgi:hypothetical protein